MDQWVAPPSMSLQRAASSRGRSAGPSLRPAVSHQTVKLGRGKHQSAEEGACVMELASMLAGESFSDHPRSVCPVIGAFLRTYNDMVDDRRRQDLYAYAAKVVASRASEEAQLARAELLLAWASEHHGRWWRKLHKRSSISEFGGVQRLAAVGARAARAIRRHTDQTHAGVLALIDELLAIGNGEPACVDRRREGLRSRASQAGSPAGEAVAAARLRRERASIELVRTRHAVT